MLRAHARPLTESMLFPIGATVTIVLLLAAPAALPQSLQIAVLLGLVVVLGFPHGALDPWIAESSGLIQGRLQTVLFNAIYLAIAAAVVTAWWLAPGLTLLGFLVISAWHFSADWSDDLPMWARLPGGALLLLMPIGFHPDVVADLFAMLSDEAGVAVAHGLALPPALLIVAMLTLAGLAAIKQRTWASVELLTLLALAWVAPPLVYFAVYFCLQHSPRHLLGHFREAGAANTQRLIKMTVLYTLGSALVLLPLIWLWSDVPLESLLMRLIFIGLAALTVPHMILMLMAEARQR